MNVLRKFSLALGAAFLQVLVFSSCPTTALASPVEDSAELFGKFDTNRDGVLSKDEIGVWPWGRYDTNKDGEVSRAEFLAGRTADRAQAAIEPDPEKAFVLLDWNNDGWLSGTELDGKWEKYDANGDGIVTKDEFLKGRSKAAPAN